MVSSLLLEVEQINEKFDRQAMETGERFNIFQIMNMERSEVNTHSALIATLLNPYATHGKGTVFLKHFITVINTAIQNQEGINGDFTKLGLIVEVEKNVVQYGRIDILVSNSRKEHIIIENKIDANDQPDQLKRYFDYGTEKSSKFWLIYLTKFGRKPDNDTTGKSDSVLNKTICISYKKEILEWLTLCKEEVAATHIVYNIILQYITLVKKITNQSLNKVMSNLIVENILSKKEDGYKAASEITKNMEKVTETLKERFINSIKAKFESLEQTEFQVTTFDDAFDDYKDLKPLLFKKPGFNFKTMLWFDRFLNMKIGVDKRTNTLRGKYAIDLELQRELTDLNIAGRQELGWCWVWLIDYDKVNHFMVDDNGLMKIADNDYDEIIDQVILDIENILKAVKKAILLETTVK